jgi:hypothetical protein
MKKIDNLFFRINIQQLFLPICFIATLSTTSIISSSYNLSVRAAESLTVSNSEVTNYAQAVLAMEPGRKAAFQTIKSLMGKEVPQIFCNSADTIGSLSIDAKKVVVNYCNASQKIVEANHLTIERFNRITQEILVNDTLKQQIQNELSRLQKNVGSH